MRMQNVSDTKSLNGRREGYGTIYLQKSIVESRPSVLVQTKIHAAVTPSTYFGDDDVISIDVYIVRVLHLECWISGPSIPLYRSYLFLPSCLTVVLEFNRTRYGDHP